MGLMQFLSVGRSLGRISDTPSRYRMTQQNLLPKFGGTKRTAERVGTCTAPVVEAPPPLCVAKVHPQPANSPSDAAVGSPKPGLIRKMLGKLRIRKPMQTFEVEATPTPVAADTPVRPETAFPQGRWTMLPNVSLFRNPFTKVPKAKEPQQPVQAELLLDAVKPVRNDLRDCDLEVIVPPGERVNENDGPGGEGYLSGESAAATTKPPGTELAWERIKSQFLGAGKH